MSRIPITRPLNIATDLTATSLEEVDFSLHELLMTLSRRGTGLIEHRTITGCRIQGPGVMLVGEGVTFDECNFGDSRGDIRNLVVRPEGSKAIGTVPVRNTSFVACEFFGVGFTGSESVIAEILSVPTTYQEMKS